MKWRKKRGAFSKSMEKEGNREHKLVSAVLMDYRRKSEALEFGKLKASHNNSHVSFLLGLSVKLS